MKKTTLLLTALTLFLSNEVLALSSTHSDEYTINIFRDRPMVNPEAIPATIRNIQPGEGTTAVLVDQNKLKVSVANTVTSGKVTFTAAIADAPDLAYCTLTLNIPLRPVSDTTSLGLHTRWPTITLDDKSCSGLMYSGIHSIKFGFGCFNDTRDFCYTIQLDEQ